MLIKIIKKAYSIDTYDKCTKYIMTIFKDIGGSGGGDHSWGGGGGGETWLLKQ